MNKTYWVWKDHNQSSSGAEIEWIQMNKQQFYDFLKTPKAESRFFIDFSDYKIEASKEEYDCWRQEINHSRYLEKQNERYIVISYHDLEERDGCIGEEFVVDESIDVQNEAIEKIAISQIREVLTCFSEEEKELIFDLYLHKKPLTEREFAEKIGWSNGKVNKTKKRLLNVLLNLPGSKPSKKSASK